MAKVHDVFWRGQKSMFLVSNPKDLVEACFVRRHFFAIEELEDLLIYVKPNSVILDIGANVGNHTVFFAKHLNAKTVMPFEVNPTAVERLRKNVELNHLTNVDLSCVGVGVGSQKGNLYLHKTVENNLGATSFSTSAASNARMVLLKVDALDNLISPDTQVDFIKIDVEGMEFEVLDGGHQLIQNWKPIVYLECWGWGARLRLMSWLIENNYRVEKKYGPGYLLMPLAQKEYYPKNYFEELGWIKLRSFAEGGEAFASEGMTRLLENFNENPHVSYAMAEIFLKLNQMEAALKAIQAVEDSADYQVIAWYQTIAELSEQCGNHSMKQEALQKAASLSPNDSQIMEQLSDAYLAGGDEETSLNLITDFLERNPESVKGHYIKSILTERRGQMTDALTHASLAARLDSPDKLNYLVRFADLTRTVEKSPVAALDIIDEAIRLGQTSDWAYQVKISILEALGRQFSARLLRAYCKTRTVLRPIKRNFSRKL